MSNKSLVIHAPRELDPTTEHQPARERVERTVSGQHDRSDPQAAAPEPHRQKPQTALHEGKDSDRNFYCRDSGKN
jgi:hypothetical protein